LAFTADCRCDKGRHSRNLITPRFGEQAGHIGGTAILCAVIILVAWFSISWIGPNDRREALVVGTVWVALTVAFEFLAGHYFSATAGRD
jgi:hypothetical protein